MQELAGISYVIKNEYSLFTIQDFTDEIKDALRSQLAVICHGEEKVKSCRKAVNYANTVKEFLKRYEDKSEDIKLGMIGELLIHLLIFNYIDSFKTVTPYFNMEERSIKKGFDLVLTENDNPTLWITEVKSGQLHKNKNSNQTINDLLGTAKRDLVTRLNDENTSLWMEAVNGATISFDSSNLMKNAILEVLGNWEDDSTDGIYTSEDKNVVLTGVLFSDIADAVQETMVESKQKKIRNDNCFNQVYLLTVHKNTYSKVYDFLKEESQNED